MLDIVPQLQLPAISRKRPRGLWKESGASRLHHQTRGHVKSTTTSPHNSDDENEGEERSSSSASSKRPRFTGHFEGDADDDTERSSWEIRHSPPPPTNITPPNYIPHVRRTRVMDTTTTAGPGLQDRTTCDYEDWEDLKELFAKTTNTYEGEDAADALPLIRGVIHECHRFLEYYQDPSVLFAAPPNIRHPRESPSTLTPPDERLARDWSIDRSRSASPTNTNVPSASQHTPTELPTTFHSILGSALFMFGNLIAQSPDLALPGEPRDPCAYWLAALDVFETGENLPSKVNGPFGATEDWRMAIVWGRTLVCLAEDMLARSLAAEPISQFSVDEHKWPPHSPFGIIAARRPPVTRRMSLSSATVNELMVLAMDQFSRGIFHMPHPQHHAPPASMPNINLPAPATSGVSTPSSEQPTFSRAKELFTIASEVLGVAERMENSEQRQYWANWADSVFNQIKMEADLAAWRGPITRARGRCWLIVGTARVEDIESALSNGESAVLDSQEAQDARDGLTTAISFFDRAKGSATSANDPESQELRPLFTEALLTLANLTADENKREELYTRAQAEGDFDLSMLESEEKGDTSMDES
ncbi:hypothetical protein PLICRDRAFT_44498 [Plicaturopsis crispa FD-325 SS-3]|nr:hypothetical protein PLICRDRAFT_44498 [Plicaturopsis crispa FD-325 SS-3]